MRLLYFAWVRERVGLDEETVSLPNDIATVDDLIAWLATRGAGYAEAFTDRTRIRAALDQAFARGDASIAGAGEIALFPPVTGG